MRKTRSCPPHHWRVESADGRERLPARCACGAERDFPSWPREVPWGRRSAVPEGTPMGAPAGSAGATVDQHDPTPSRPFRRERPGGGRSGP